MATVARNFILVTLMTLSPAFAHGQLPNAPSAVQTCQNGKSFAKGATAKLVGSCPFDKRYENWDGAPDGFFHFGDSNRWLHPMKKSYAIFFVAHVGLWAATAVAVHKHLTSREEAHSEYPAVAAMTGLDFLVFKTVSPSLSVGAPVYGMIHYSIAAAR